MVLGVLGFILFLSAWHLTAVSGAIRPEFLPTPLAVAEAFVRLFTERGFAEDIVISVGRVWFAFLLSVAVAVPLGLYMSTYRVVGAILEPFIDFVRYLPVPALVPLLVIWFGVGEASKIAVLWMGTFFQLILLIADDTKRVPAEYVEAGHTLGASNGEIMRHIIIPAALPNMIDNLRITLGWCWTYLIIAEIVAANSGIGHVIWSLRRFVKTPEVMAGIIAIGIIGLLTDQAFRYAHRRAFAYLRK
ncbi:ABC transporter permease [Rhodobacteraceae bacterium CCMM004]|nr:ABC transporter permease [Rhodobacteraceae bacterium CCMM004]